MVGLLLFQKEECEVTYVVISFFYDNTDVEYVGDDRAEAIKVSSTFPANKIRTEVWKNGERLQNHTMWTEEELL